jgi:c-di-GMP-binding flagellar brake protein YcgR
MDPNRLDKMLLPGSTGLDEPLHARGELRETTRVPYACRVQVIGGEGPETFAASDISRGGIAYEVPRHLKAGHRDQRVVVRGALPGTGSVFWALGRVVRGHDTVRGTTRFGVAFTGLTEENHRRLSSYLAMQPPAM